MDIKLALTFDDVLLVPQKSSVIPNDVSIKTQLTRDIILSIPLISSAMDTVTESDMAIAMAKSGGIGIIHKNLSIDEQVNEVKKVKKYESGMIVNNPLIINEHCTVAQAISVMSDNQVSGVPVIGDDNKLVGIVTNRDVRFLDGTNALEVGDIMTKNNLVTVSGKISEEEAKVLFSKHKIERLIVINKQNECVGLITVKDIDKSIRYPNACKDSRGRLRVGVAVGTGTADLQRAERLIDADVDVIVIDTAHGHSTRVLEMVRLVRNMSSSIGIVGGNIATGEAAQALIDSGVDTVKVGIGPGSICTTRIVAGVGVPQLTAVEDVYKVCKEHNVPVIADGGIRYSGDIAKAVAVGADCIMVGSLLAGTEESPGEVILYQGRSYKSYRGMGSVSAMARGSADRYFQQDIRAAKLVPEGVEGRVPFKGAASAVIDQLTGGLKAAMGYTGNKNIDEMKRHCKFVRITNSGLKESHAHDVFITKESSNYWK